MDEDMEIVPVLEAHEVDLDYEFDAPVFFDFTRDELLSELHSAEAWFRDAASYPPSPFISKLVWFDQNGSLKNAAGTSDCISYFDHGVTVGEQDGDSNYTRAISNAHSCRSEGLGLSAGPLHANVPANGGLRNIKPTIKQKSFKSSTLMKPTASILAKQYQLRVRFPNSVSERHGIGYNYAAVESQAAKKQKLDCGLAHKVGHAKQQCEFLHKEPKKNPAISKASIPKTRLTIPKEPHFATAKRVHKIRNVTEPTTTEHGFKARPLNRKILQAPLFPLPKRTTPKLPEFQEFNFKTSERAIQHATSSTSQPNSLHHETKKPDIGKKESTSTKKQDSSAHIFAFKSRTRDAKLSKIKAPHNPPVELFSKLSLAPELLNRERLRLNTMNIKESKENQLPKFYPHHNEITHSKGSKMQSE